MRVAVSKPAFRYRDVAQSEAAQDIACPLGNRPIFLDGHQVHTSELLQVRCATWEEEAKPVCDPPWTSPGLATLEKHQQMAQKTPGQ